MDPDARPVLDQLNLVVSDMGASLAFYRRCGLDVSPTLPEWEGHHRTLSTPEGLDLDLDSRTFARQWDAGWAPERTGPVIGFKLGFMSPIDAGRRAEMHPPS